MKPDLLHLISLLKERLQALRDLAGEITGGQKALVQLDFGGLQHHDTRKEQICIHVRRLDREIATILGTIAPQGSLRKLAEEIEASRNEPQTAGQLRHLLEESGTASAEVARLNKEYGEFLRRSRGTLNILINVVFHCLGIYPPPLTSPNLSLGRSV